MSNIESELSEKNGGYPMTEIAPGMYAIDITRFYEKYDFFAPIPDYS